MGQLSKETICSETQNIFLSFFCRGGRLVGEFVRIQEEVEKLSSFI